MRRRKVCGNMAITFSAKNIICWEFWVQFGKVGLTLVSPLFHPVFTSDSPNYTELRHFECSLTSDWLWTLLETTLGSPPSHPCFTPYSSRTHRMALNWGISSAIWPLMDLGLLAHPHLNPVSAHSHPLFNLDTLNCTVLGHF